MIEVDTWEEILPAIEEAKHLWLERVMHFGNELVKSDDEPKTIPHKCQRSRMGVCRALPDPYLTLMSEGAPRWNHPLPEVFNAFRLP